ncbi:MAG: Polyphosphate kinase 2 [Acidimicrobiaceae bacterium]|nr:Polyphosphate kinase 2 [Acidimicrobiaceae bacterium]
MRLEPELLDELIVRPGEPASLEERSTIRTRSGWGAEIGVPDRTPDPKKAAKRLLKSSRADLAVVQEQLYRADSASLLVILQGPDASGKDSTIKHVMAGVNPQGCSVVSFKAPSAEELAHDYLWRHHNALPARGHIGIFNRSYYEEVLVVRVHPRLLDNETVAPGTEPGPELWRERYEAINAFEDHLVRSATCIVKFYLHVSKREQRRRLVARLEDPGKRWKFSSSDVAERAFFDQYRVAYEDALTATSTEAAPWYVVPADDKPTLRALVAGVVVTQMDRMNLVPRPISASESVALEVAREELLAGRD